ncbi:MAG: DNA mismatch repair endonuclease MutL [Anaerolineales bacterium]|nr:DNA mismatch repair endonuclease MutL [Anaerolineales bacterium]
MPIRILSPEIASQIAAGEVVERPASVVKELLENALDAGARSVSVTIAAAGRTLIEVADDGSGISAEELPLALARHATSKLSRAEDLFAITTLGFRGEALSSIGSVARLAITSRAADSASGARLKVEAGVAGRLESVGAPIGTLVRVEDLFYNVPARLKFLKQDVTERRAIDALLTRYALAYPHVRFKLVEGSTLALHTSGDGDRRAILAALYGVEVAKQMLEVTAEEEGPSTGFRQAQPASSGQGLRLTGFISPTALTRSNRKEITFFVNGRWIQDVPLTTALLRAYHTMLMVGRYPLAAIFLEIQPEEVDVNVHPAKAEVRFRSPDRIFSFVQRAVRRALLAYSPVPPATPSLWGAQAGQVDPAWRLAHDAYRGPWTEDRGNLPEEGQPPTVNGQLSTVIAQAPTLGQVPLLRLVGQIGATYLVAEGPDGLYLIDQHAAHERVLFDKLMAQHGTKNTPSQTLLQPVVVAFPPQSAHLLISQLPVLEHFGFGVEPFGPNTFQVRAMPALFAGSDPAAALRALVEDFEEDETPLQHEVEARIAGRVCKRLAVKAGQVLSPEEQRAMLNDLEACASPRTCPHGRPTMIHLSVDMLERQFGRKGVR